MIEARGLRLWFAEDDEADWLLIKRSLKKNVKNAIVTRCVDGQECWDMLLDAVDAGKPLPNIILLDINMPRMTGLDLLKNIKGNRTLRSIPVLILTTSLTDASVCYDFGVNVFYNKPYNNSEASKLFAIIWTHWINAAVHRDSLRDRRHTS